MTDAEILAKVRQAARDVLDCLGDDSKSINAISARVALAMVELHGEASSDAAQWHSVLSTPALLPRDRDVAARNYKSARGRLVRIMSVIRAAVGA